MPPSPPPLIACSVRPPSSGPTSSRRPTGPPWSSTFGQLPGTVVARSRHAATVPDRPGVLDELHDALEGEGWEFRRPWGAVERLVGRLDGVELRATYAAETGALLVVLTSDSLVVGADHARELVRH